MSFITKADLGDIIYSEKIDIISRGDDAMVEKAISRAISQVQGYLSNYDYATIFAITDEDERLKYDCLIGYTLDIAKWHFIKICNAGVDLQLAKECYDDAIAELLKIQSGKVVYSDWAVIADNVDLNNGFSITSNPKRETYF
ncbi:MAG: DUF1320 domain-containing protein [Flavobacteriales bacterium]|nr:MAG: DUF1320 domain-containing protein [Flavobacteriales bacterium]